MSHEANRPSINHRSRIHHRLYIGLGIQMSRDALAAFLVIALIGIFGAIGDALANLL